MPRVTIWAEPGDRSQGWGRYWQRARKDVEDVLVEFDKAGWRIEDPPTYYTVKCPCGTHKRWIHLTPSDPNYLRNAVKWLHRQSCYKDREQ